MNELTLKSIQLGGLRGNLYDPCSIVNRCPKVFQETKTK